MKLTLPKMYPHLWFDTQAREAAEFYCSVFPNSQVKSVVTIRDTPSGNCDVVTFELAGNQFQAISAGPIFKFNEAISIVVQCKTQEEIDYYFGKLSAVPESEQCGWVKDRYGLSWQIVPEQLEAMMNSGNEKKIAAVVQAFLQMKKFDIAALEKAYAAA